MNKIPSLPPKASTASAIVVGYLLIDDLDALEQNALGNWLMLTAQVICTNAYFTQIRENNNQENEKNRNNSEKNKLNDQEQEIAMLTKMVNALNKEIAILKSKL